MPNIATRTTRAGAIIAAAIGLTVLPVVTGGTITAQDGPIAHSVTTSQGQPATDADQATAAIAAVAQLNPLALQQAAAASNYQRCHLRGIPIKLGYCVAHAYWEKGKTTYNRQAGRNETTYHEVARGYWNGLFVGHTRTGEWKIVPS